MARFDETSWTVPIEVMLRSLKHGEVQACSIFNVPEELREANEDAYTPKHISIGPIHRRATRHLHLMEENKWRLMHKFLNRNSNVSLTLTEWLKDCGNNILKKNDVISASYGGSNYNIVQQTNSHEITKIMIVDGCSLLELLMKIGDYMENPTTIVNNDDPIFETEEITITSVLNDIAMLENQIPFVVLKILYRKVFPDFDLRIEDDYRVCHIVCKAFGYAETDIKGGAHILNLMHLSTVEDSQQQPHEGKKAKLELLSCATKLRAFGVKIRVKSNNTNQDNHNLADMFDFDICFSDSGELDIPPLYIKETTEVKWRNLIAWEQSKIWIRSKYTSYALFFNGLICCEHDIEFLIEKGVIINKMNKSNKDLLALFRKISKGVKQMDSSYTDYCEKLNVHDEKLLQKWPILVWHECRRFFDFIVYLGRKWYSILIHDHIPNVWKFIGILAAILLLVLTMMQTYYSSHSS